MQQVFSALYDGNPLTYDGWTFTWKAGRMLAGMVKTGANAQFTYDHNGLRVKKVVNGVTNSYTLSGKNVVHITQGSNDLHFYYDAQGKPAMVRFNGEDYFYVYNLQGDVVALIDTSCSQMVECTYDAWGALLAKTGTLAATLGTLNPFRYRGYVYDEETGLYYLRSRYYHPVWKRFINADRVGERNLFLYCRNSPVFRVDNDGNKSSACNFEQFQGKFGDKMSHVINQDYKDGRMPVAHFIALLQQMVSEKWEYSHNTAYGAVDCVGIYRYTMNWFYNQSSYKFMKVFTNVEGTYRQSVYNSTIEKRNVLGKGKLTEDTILVEGMALFRNPLGKDAHVAYYVGDQFEGYTNAVVEAVLEGVVVRELSESEEINGEFTHYGYLKGLDYTD